MMKVILRYFAFVLIAITSNLSPVSSKGLADINFEDPELMLSLFENPAFGELLQNENLQDYLQTVIVGGDEALAKRLEEDPDARAFFEQLAAIVQNHEEL